MNMKLLKILVLSFVLLPSLLMAQESGTNSAKAKSSSPYGLGGHLALDYSFIWGLADDWNNGDEEDSPSGVGVVLGLVGKMELFPYLQFTPELNFRYGKLTQDDDVCERNFSQMDLQIPLLFRGIATDRIFAMAGPQVNMSISNEVSVDANIGMAGGLSSINHSMKEKMDQSLLNVGFVLGFGANIIENLYADIRVFMGFMELYPDAESKLVDMSGAKLMSINLDVGYWFL